MIRVWTFPVEIDTAKAPDGTIYDAIYAPDQFNHDRWRKVRFQIVVRTCCGRQVGRWHQVLAKRYLSDEEVEAFLETHVFEGE